MELSLPSLEKASRSKLNVTEAGVKYAGGYPWGCEVSSGLA